MDSTITIRVSDEDKALFKSLSSQEGLSLSDWARKTILSQIEDEYDIRAYEEFLKDEDQMLYTTEEVEKILGL